MIFPLHGERLIEASAGTGKTYSITSLYLRLLLGHGKAGCAYLRPLTVNEILVVTFTNAATQELRGRIRQRIVQARRAFQISHETNDEQEIEPFLGALLSDIEDHKQAVALLDAAIKLMDEAAIFTIHSFCQRMLQENAFETGILFEMQMEMDGTQLRHTALLDT